MTDVLGNSGTTAIASIHRNAGAEPADHPHWCTRMERPGGNHRSHMLLGHVPGDEIAVRVGLRQLADVAITAVLLDIEETDVERRIWPLEIHQAEDLADAFRRLELACLTPTHDGAAAHPPWCLGTEASGRSHRSAKISANAAGDLLGVWTFLGQPVLDDELAPNEPGAYLEVRADDSTYLWPVALHQMPLIRLALNRAVRWLAR